MQVRELHDFDPESVGDLGRDQSEESEETSGDEVGVDVDGRGLGDGQDLLELAVESRVWQRLPDVAGAAVERAKVLLGPLEVPEEGGVVGDAADFTVHHLKVGGLQRKSKLI